MKISQCPLKVNIYVKFVLGVFNIHNHAPVDYSSKFVIFVIFLVMFSKQGLWDHQVLIFSYKFGIIVKVLLIEFNGFKFVA
jgi:hypothetical protein